MTRRAWRWSASSCTAYVRARLCVSGWGRTDGPRPLSVQTCFRCTQPRCTTTLRETNYAISAGSFYCKTHHRLLLAGATSSGIAAASTAAALAPAAEPFVSPTPRRAGATAAQGKPEVTRLKSDEQLVPESVPRPRSNSTMLAKSFSPTPAPPPGGLSSYVRTHAHRVW
jgi:hypothetical protein